MTVPAADTSAEYRASNSTLFRAEGLHKSFGGVQAVRDISLRISRGIVFAIIGPNGAGKSTLLNLMSGVHQPDAGRMVLDGVDLVGRQAHQRVRLGLARTFQKIRLFRQLSVLDNVVAGFHIHHDIPAWQYIVHGARFRRDQARCRDQALELARALATSPRLLMVDEPAAGLNAAEVERLLERIRLLRERGLTIIVVEHNMDLVMKIADRVLVMDYGQYLFEGTPAEAQTNPAVIAAYLGA